MSVEKSQTRAAVRPVTITSLETTLSPVADANPDVPRVRDRLRAAASAW
ncbi:hypothetical protein [Streptomyces sp. NBC_00582]|nr:hypothetical protein [Streptomyces sp. NBC_00582]WUB66573.1 hypothetical protein OG852_42250 [Streptomyces sp. NBC_00582]